MTDKPACETPRAPWMTCVKPAGHDGFHETPGGTEFTPSGKIGLGKVGDDFKLGPKRRRHPQAFLEGERHGAARGQRLYDVVASNLHILRDVSQYLNRIVDGRGSPYEIHAAAAKASEAWLELDRAHRFYMECEPK